MSRRSSISRSFAGCLAAVLVVSSCGAQESSTGDRDRNVGTKIEFATASAGVARSRIGDLSLNQPLTLIERRQRDGSSLIAVPTVAADKRGTVLRYDVTRIDANGVFDEGFGKNGVAGFTQSMYFDTDFLLTSDGRAVISTHDTSVALGQKTGILVVDAATGQPDAKFGDNGAVPIENFDPKSRKALAEDAGAFYVLRDASAAPSANYAVTRVTPAGVDTAFGINGLVEMTLPKVGDLVGNQSYSCRAPQLWERAAGVRVLYMCQIFEADPNTKAGKSWWVIVSRELSRTGEMIGAEHRVRLNAADSPIDGNHEWELVDVDTLDGELDSEHLVTIQDHASRHLVQIFDNFTQPRVATTALPSTVISSQRWDIASLSSATYISKPGSTKPLGVVGIVIDGSNDATSLELGDMTWRGGALRTKSGVKLFDYAWPTHTVADLQYTGDSVFMNVPFSSSYIERQGLATSRVTTRNRYTKIGPDGAIVSPYASADEAANSPLNRGFTAPVTTTMPGLLPAVDGSLYALGVSWGFADAGDLTTAVLHVQKYGAGGSADGDVIEIGLGRLSPNPIQKSMIAAFDGVDAFYVPGHAGGKLAYTKVSLSKRAVDTSYGDKGVVYLPDDADNQGMGDAITEPDLQANTDGSVDVVFLDWSTDENPIDRAVIVRTMHFTAVGQRDAALPDATARIPDIHQCSCLLDADLRQLDVRPVVDAQGRLLVALPDITQGNAQDADNPAANFGGAVLRFNRDGSADTSFGVNGRGGAKLADVIGDFPWGTPQIAVAPTGKIFMAMAVIVLSSENGLVAFDFTVEGEFIYAVMLDENGNAAPFTKAKPNPAAKQLIETINKGREEVGGAPATNDASTDAPASIVVSPPGFGVDLVAPAGDVQVSRSATPVITIAGTPADRTIEVRWSIPESLAGGKAEYTVTASPGGQKCTTASNTCVFKKLEPWTAYSFTIKTVAASSTAVADSVPSLPVKPVRIIKRGTITEPTKLITPASSGKQTWKATGGCKVTKDGKTFTATKDAGLCTLSLTTAKAGKVPKTTRVITVVVRAIAK